MENNTFRHFSGLKRMFGTADYVRPYVVSNIAGNKYRLISVVDYEMEAVSVKHMLTHAEYDKGKWKQ